MTSFRAKLIAEKNGAKDVFLLLAPILKLYFFFFGCLLLKLSKTRIVVVGGNCFFVCVFIV